MNDATTIKTAWYDAQKRRPYKSDAEVIKAITPPGGEWTCEVPEGAIRRSVIWGAIEVAYVNPRGQLGDSIESDIAMGLRATPVMDTALRTILVLAESAQNVGLIRTIAETAIAYVEMPAPAIKEPPDDEENDPDDEPADDDIQL